ncbi:MAG: hypothetical protein SGJ27_18620 [Candidatus Melainabacteria bacterium]|nr:hypothetical protein [Candidatus Melainabacteria bacterium]
MSQDLNTKGIFKQNVVLSLDDVGLVGELTVPENAHSVIMFVDGAGSTSPDSINSFVARELNKFGHATLTFDLTTDEEEAENESHNRIAFGFHTEFLSQRVMEAYRWLRLNGDTEKLSVGIFGTGSEAEAAILAASHLRRKIAAMVIAGGWISLPPSILEQVKSPTLLITRDDKLEELLQTQGMAKNFSCEYHLETISQSEQANYGQERLAELTREWFSWYMAKKK